MRMHWNDHPPTHFHVEYGGLDATFDIEGLYQLDGKLPTRVRRLVVQWATLHQDELRDAWEKASREETPERIAPLR